MFLKRLLVVAAEKGTLEQALSETKDELEEAQEDTSACIEKIAYLQNEVVRIEHEQAASDAAQMDLSTQPAGASAEVEASLEAYRVLLAQSSSAQSSQEKPADLREALKVALARVGALQSEYCSGQTNADRWVWVDRCGVSRCWPAVGAAGSIAVSGPEERRQVAKWNVTKEWMTERYKESYNQCEALTQHFAPSEPAAAASSAQQPAATLPDNTNGVLVADAARDNGIVPRGGDAEQKKKWAEVAEWAAESYRQTESLVLERGYASVTAAVDAATTEWWPDWVWVDRCGVYQSWSSYAKAEPGTSERTGKRQAALAAMTERYKQTAGGVLTAHVTTPDGAGRSVSDAGADNGWQDGYADEEEDSGAYSVGLLARAVIRLTEQLQSRGAHSQSSSVAGTPTRGTPVLSPSLDLPLSMATPGHNLMSEVEKLRDMSRLDSPTMVAHIQEQLEVEKAAVEEHRAEVRL